MVILAAAAGAKQEQVTTRGFDATRPFQFNEADSVDTLSGNLVIRVPLGTEYVTNGTLRYSFGLTYNSNIWDYQQLETGGTVRGIALTYDEMVSGFDKITDGDLPPDFNGLESYPPRISNSGLGWTISLGEIKDGYTYVSPDGASHSFYSSLTGTIDNNDPWAHPGPLYTRDGTFLRMTKVSASERLIEFPDGIRKRFVCRADCNKKPDPAWYLDEISDPFGNILLVDRSPDVRPASGLWTWTFTERSLTGPTDAANYIRRADAGTLVRSHTLTFKITHSHEMRLENASLAARGGPAQYAFEYSDRDVYRERGSTWAGPGLRAAFNGRNKVPVSTLSKVTLPAAGGSWQFKYVIMDSSPGHDLLPVTWGNTTFHTSKKDGRLWSMTLPSGGRVEYEYEGRILPARRCDAKAGENLQLGMLGVSRRRVYDVGSATPAGEWRYYVSRYKTRDNPPPTKCNRSKEYVVTVVGPGVPSAPGSRQAAHHSVSVSFFSAYKDDENYKDPGQPWAVNEHGLPFTKAVTDGDGRYLSQAVYSCAPGVFDTDTEEALRKLLAHRRLIPQPGQTEEPATCGVPLRSSYVRYEHSGLDCTGSDAQACSFSQRRVASSRDVYHSQGGGGDAETYMDTINSDYDGLGHYRVSKTGGNILQTIFSSGTDERISKTQYNPDVSYSAGSHQVVGMPQRWLLNTYDSSEVRERRNGSASNPENVARTEYHFNADSGFLLRSRRLGSNNGTRAATDVLQVFERTRIDDTTVNVREKWYGGDSVAQNGKNSMSDERLPDVDLPATPEYVIDRRHQYGSLKLAQYMNCDLSAPFMTVESNVIDAASGLVTSSTDHSGAVSSFTWDTLGRVTSYTPQGEAATSYEYPPATSNRGPQVTVSRGTGELLVSESITADGFGRVVENRSRIPDRGESGAECSGECWSTKLTTYLAGGQLETTSVTRDAAQAPGWRVTRTWYDALGRPVTVQKPDNSKTTYLHFGKWHVQEDTPTLGFRDLFYDRHGRLVKITEGSGAPFRYEYDSSNRLVEVKAIGTYGDVRSTFEYDNRGNLFREYHPEIGVHGIRYEYDSRGNVLQKTFPNEPSRYDLRITYDAAEGPVDVLRGDKVIKHFTYHPSTTPMAGGKIATATRLNIIPEPGATTTAELEHTVTNEFQYHPTTGRLHTSKVSSTTGFSALTTYNYDALGQLTSLRYPDSCAPTTPCSRLLAYSYRHGFQRSISGFVSTTRYHPNGLLRKLVRTNGTQDETQLPDSGMARPSRIESSRIGSSGAVQAFERFGSDVVPITYNGAGNITSMGRMSGIDQFGYDDLGRITSASVGGRSQGYVFDAFGNLTSITGTNARTLTIDRSTNQLSPPAAGYDHAGNLLYLPDPRQPDDEVKFRFEWDSHGLIKHHSGPGIGRVFLYDAFDERVGTIDYVTSAPHWRELWTARDAGNRVLSDFERVGSEPYARKRDYIHNGSAVVAVVTVGTLGESAEHLHPDHLGTSRAITDASGGLVVRRDYFPFGEETIERNLAGRLEFTGHERDDDGTLNPGGDLDYMHARHYAPALGRFLSADPRIGTPALPQSWNRYAYVRNNPATLTDPTGRCDSFLCQIERLEPKRQTPIIAASPTMIIGDGPTVARLSEASGGSLVLNRWSTSTTPLGQAGDQATSLIEAVTEGKVSGVADVSRHQGQTVETLLKDNRPQYAAEVAAKESLEAAGALNKFGRATARVHVVLQVAQSILQINNYAKFVEAYKKNHFGQEPGFVDGFAFFAIGMEAAECPECT